jgi:serine/threonine protein phosphatase PrpC
VSVVVKGSLEFSIKGPCPSQEDALLSLPDRRIFAVSDGIGCGVAGKGAKAAQSVCEAVKQFLVKEAGDEEATLPFVLRSYFSLAGNVLFNSLYHANRAVRRINQGQKLGDQVGASALAAYVDGDLLALANVGSCSAWLMRGGHSTELVKPRTLGALIDPMGQQSLSELPESSRNLPLICLGTSEDLEPEIFEVRLSDGDWVLLCTDGIQARMIPSLLAIQSHQCGAESSIAEVRDAISHFRVEDNASGILLMV